MKFLSVKPLFIFIFSSLLATLGAAQVDDWESVIKVRSFGSNVNLRSEPSREGEVLKRLAAGEEIGIIAELEDSITVDGIRAPWLEVATADGVTGYVWGGMVAIYNGEVELIGLGKGVLMLRAAGNPGGKNDLRFLQDGKVKKEWEVTLSEQNTWVEYLDVMIDESLVESYGSGGFTPPVSFVAIRTTGCPCACFDFADFFTWDGKDWKYAFTTHSWAYENEGANIELTFPEDEGGIKNKVIITEITTSVKENAVIEGSGNDLPVTEEKTVTIFEWKP